MLSTRFFVRKVPQFITKISAFHYQKFLNISLVLNAWIIMGFKNSSKITFESFLLLPWVLGNVEVLIRLIIVVKNQNCQTCTVLFVVKNQNCQACTVFVFPSSPLSCRFSIFNVLSFTFFIIATAILFLSSTASFRSVRAPSVQWALSPMKELTHTEMRLCRP